MANTAAYHADQFTPVVFDPALATAVKPFLIKLNDARGLPLETLLPAQARQALPAAQAAVEVDMLGIEVTEQPIESEGLTVKLHLVRPAGTAGKALPVFLFIHGGGWVISCVQLNEEERHASLRSA